MTCQWSVLAICVIVGGGTACGKETPEALARIRGTSEGSSVSGAAQFNETSEGLRITVTVANVPPGQHGFHIHEYGDCADQGKAAGGHYNPAGVQHGFLPADGFAGAHAGDFGNIEVGPNGTGVLTLTLQGLTLRDGPHAVDGKAVILHEKLDDFGQPTGNAGGRIGCGIIERTGN